MSHLFSCGFVEAEFACGMGVIFGCVNKSEVAHEVGHLCTQ